MTGLFFIISMGIVSLGPSYAHAQEKLKAEPAPSYSEAGPATSRHPEVDTDIDLYFNHWRNSLPHEGHGGLVERDILTPGDPFRPAKKGAVLKYIKAYKRGVLQRRTNTAPTRHESDQVFFYVSFGKGRVEAGGKTAS
ncbi:MAG: hypothetical protein AB1715_08710, partial [Acidobacteriota bacterium]